MGYQETAVRPGLFHGENLQAQESWVQGEEEDGGSGRVDAECAGGQGELAGEEQSGGQMEEGGIKRASQVQTLVGQDA